MANTGQIIKSKSTERFTTIPNEIIKSKSLSMSEKGLLVYLLSLPTDWVLYKSNLHNHLPDKKGTIDKTFKSLQEKGYILSIKVHNPQTGRFIGWNHVVYDIPAELDNFRQSSTPSSVNSEVGKSAPIQKTNLILKTNLKQKKENTQKECVSFSSKKDHAPELHEVETFFEMHGSSKEAAKLAFDYYDAGKWHDKGGNRVVNWQQKMLLWISRQKEITPAKNSLKMPNNDKEPKMEDFYDYAEYEKAVKKYNKKINIK
jgi:hypothetical protein